MISKLSTRLSWNQNSHPHGNFKLTWGVHKVKTISKFPPHWNFKLAWSLHKVKMISKFPPPWNFKLTWTVHKVINVGLWNLDVAFWDLRLCLWNLEFHSFLICLQSFAVPVKQFPPKVSPSLCRLVPPHYVSLRCFSPVGPSYVSSPPVRGLNPVDGPASADIAINVPTISHFHPKFCYSFAGCRCFGKPKNP